MAMSTTLLFLALTAAPDDAGWNQVAAADSVIVYARQKAGASVAEMKATGIIDGPPHAVWKVVRDYANFDKTMPYTEESKVLGSEEGGKVIYFYSVVNAPLVSRRDYVIRLVDESDWREGQGYLKVIWKAVADKGPPPREGIVRLQLNDGSWLLEPRENGAKTFATYYLNTDPGGSIPKWIANKANGTAVPNVFRSVRRAVAQAR